MKPHELLAHKHALKMLTASPRFRQMNKSKWPKPFNRMARPRVQATDLISVSEAHRVLLMWRDGEEITDRAFYGHLLWALPQGDLYPLLEFHYHPSHKGVHCKMPCETAIDYRNRLLPGAPELNLGASRILDPRVPDDRSALVVLFCRAAGITISNEQNGQGDLLC